MKSDIEIARETKLKPIKEVALSIGISEDKLFYYGNYMAKVEPKQGKGKLILVTAINPTKGGEGKTTISIGLADAMKRVGANVALALREPSLGPVFGIKGGAAGGGYAQIAPMDDINLHFTGDLHAITSANNLLSAMIDNHIYWGNELDIAEVTWHRCMDTNDRALRFIREGIRYNERDDSFDITAASEVMATLCLSSDFNDLKQRLGDIVIGFNSNNKEVTARDLKANEAMAILLKDAVKPNLVQTLEGVPAFVHGGPFANIAHGCNSVMATRTALSYADYCVTEAGFGADLGAEKFFDIKCRVGNFNPDCVVIVATLRALKCAGGKTDNLSSRDDEALIGGLPNLARHVENVTKVFNRKCVVALNRFLSDGDEEIKIVVDEMAKLSVNVVCAECFAKGSSGGEDLAREVIRLCNQKTAPMSYAYELDDTVEQKITKIATRLYGASGVEFSDKAKQVLKKIKGTEFEKLPVCIAKTQYSFSDNPKLLGAPKDFKITVRDLYLRAGPKFVVAVAGDIMLMPGLGKVPNAEKMTINDGIIEGLF